MWCWHGLLYFKVAVAPPECKPLLEMPCHPPPEKRQPKRKAAKPKAKVAAAASKPKGRKSTSRAASKPKGRKSKSRACVPVAKKRAAKQKQQKDPDEDDKPCKRRKYTMTKEQKERNNRKSKAYNSAKRAALANGMGVSEALAAARLAPWNAIMLLVCVCV